ncbi:MAG: MutS-related protein [Acidimicrobiales bacterium]
MKAHLMYPDRDFNAHGALPPNAGDLVADLELHTLFEAMAGGDKFLYEVSKTAVLSSLADPAAIAYRQHVLDDCVAHPEVVREMYDIAVAAVEGERRIWGFLRQYPSGVLHRSIEALQLFVGHLRRLKRLAEAHAAGFSSEGLTTLCAMLARELDDEYFRTVEEHLRRLKFKGGVLVSAGLGSGNKGERYVLRTSEGTRQTWKERIGAQARSSYSFEISPRDEAGARALGTLADHGINLVANALAQSSDHVLGFFTMLRSELGFYVSCLNLRDRLVGRGEPVCMPAASAWDGAALSFSALYDACLALRTGGQVVGNDLEATGRTLVVITGANSGGKSTFLRSLCQAQLMMQCGMFVAAASFAASACEGVFTHFIREEDAGMDSGRFDEELSRMSGIAELITPHCIVAFNESFSGTNEQEGSEIARQVVRALLDTGGRVFFVTHLYDLAESFYSAHRADAVFLRSTPEPDGRRNFKLSLGEPLPTSHGRDLYERLGGWETSVLLGAPGAGGSDRGGGD